MLITKCGLTRSNRGKLFTKQSLEQHERDCRRCNPNKTEFAPEELGLEWTDMIADDDMPDGAYWAIAWELGEW